MEIPGIKNEEQKTRKRQSTEVEKHVQKLMNKEIIRN